MNATIVVRAALLVALGFAAAPARAVVTTLELCKAPVKLTLRQPGFRDLSWTVCGAGGKLGAASAAWDTATEAYSEELSAAVQAEEERARTATATRLGDSLDVALEIDVAGERRKLEARALAIGAAPRAVAGVKGATVQAETGKGKLVTVNVENEKVKVVARRLGEVADLRIDGIDRLDDTPITLIFQLIPARSVPTLVADVGGVLLLQAHPDRYAFSTTTEAKVFRAAFADLDSLRGGDDRPALEAALSRVVAAAPMPPEGPAVDISAELDELARLHAARKDYAGAEKLHRQRLALEERIGGTRESAAAIEALDQVATLRDMQDDRAGAETLFREVTQLGERFVGGDRQPVAHAWQLLAIYASFDRDDAEAERRFARATAIVREYPIDGVKALETNQVLLGHAFVLDQLGRHEEAAPLLERRLAIMNAHYGEKSSMSGRAMEELANNATLRDDLVRAAEWYVDALMIRTRENDPSPRTERLANEAFQLVAALGPYARREQAPGDAAKLRKSLVADPPSPDLLSLMTGWLAKRAERQRGQPAQAITCDGYAELVAARVRAVGDTKPELVARMSDTARRDCLAPKG